MNLWGWKRIDLFELCLLYIYQNLELRPVCDSLASLSQLQFSSHYSNLCFKYILLVIVINIFLPESSCSATPTQQADAAGSKSIMTQQADAGSSKNIIALIRLTSVQLAFTFFFILLYSIVELWKVRQ